MGIGDGLVLQRQRHLKWKGLDPPERPLVVLCVVLLFGFSLSVCCDIVPRLLGTPWLWLQEVTSTLFIYAIFLGAAVATRRNDHLYLTAFAEAMHGPARVVTELTIRFIVLAVAAILIYTAISIFSVASAASACPRTRRSPRCMRPSRLRGY